MEYLEDDIIEIIEDCEEELIIPNDEKKILWQAKDFSIREFLTMKADGDLILQPDYQRDYVATNKIASRLVESILMDVPIPVVFLAEEPDGTMSIIDGQQRLTTFISFLEGKFPDGRDFRLSSLPVLKELNRKSFGDLDDIQKKKIRNTTIHSIIIKKESNPDMKFEIFERLNTGSTKLNENEIRNNSYRGEYINLIKELSEDKRLDILVNKRNFKKRMGYQGLVLRFLSISEKSYLNYRSPMKQFCNNNLRDNLSIHISKLKEYKERFEHCLELTDIVFGEKSFRKYSYKDGEQSGNWVMGQINTALFDIQMCGFVNYDKNQILSKADQIRDRLIHLMINNQEFIESISNRTSNSEAIKTRFKIYMNMLDEIIQKPTNRLFSFHIKEQLFNQNPTCAISGQKILKIEDAEVDHIVPYSKGGETDISNAQLVLRYFNRAKKDNQDYKIS
jgi:5-methylcytosine-specific restriction endonuclease McrA